MKGFLIKGALLVSLRRSFTRRDSFYSRLGDTFYSLIDKLIYRVEKKMQIYVDT